jgi:hypothetical protein
MRSRRICLTAAQIALLTAIASTSVPAAEFACRTDLPDGRVVLSRPVMGGHGLFCQQALDDAFARRHEAARMTLPQMSFTTGQLGPFTTGELGPFTTFSNSPLPHPQRH